MTPEDKQKSDILFHQCDANKDGLVTGAEVRDVFLRTGVPQLCLAHIWSVKTFLHSHIVYYFIEALNNVCF